MVSDDQIIVTLQKKHIFKITNLNISGQPNVSISENNWQYKSIF